MKSLSVSGNSKFSAVIVLMLSMVLSLFAISSNADEDDNAGNGPDPSARVARISFLQGTVSLQLAQADEWVGARLNRPLTNRDQIFTDSGSRAELQIGMATVHLDENTQLGLMELSDNVLQLRLNQGILGITVRGMDNDDTVEVDTPNASVTIPEPGSYRIEVSDHDDLTVVQVRDGSAEVVGERQRYTVQEKEQLRLRGSNRLNAQFDDLDRMDDFDRWITARNSRARNATASRYVDANVIGYEDLDDNGYWGWEASYRNVWYPNRVVAGWSPYRFGHWDWISPWGWTWIDDASWGFAPFHYGRWAEVHHRWCWVPGRREIRAVYAPALVAWVGSPGASVSLTVGGSVGWIPLGPREIYRPHYRASAVYLSRVNVSNSLLRRDEYDRLYHRATRDENFVNRGAASVVAAATFTSAVNVHRNLLPVPPRDLRPVENLERLRPDRAAIIGGPRVITPPARVIDREVVVQRRPSPFAPRADMPASRDTPVGGSVRLIEPVAPRRSVGGDRDGMHNDRNVGPMQRDDSHDSDVGSRRFDRWGRNNGMENRVEPRDEGAQPRREWRPNAPTERRESVEPANAQPRVVQPPQDPPVQPERHRIGPWVHDEQQLRPAPTQPQREPQANPAPRADPPRSARPAPPPPQSPPPNNSSDNNRSDDGGRHPPQRREIR